MSQAVRNFLSNEEHAGNVIIGGAAAIMAIGFVVAVAAILLMK
jgi:hypothetical protein